MTKRGRSKFRVRVFKARWLLVLSAVMALLAGAVCPVQAVSMDQAKPGEHAALPEGHPAMDGAAATNEAALEDLEQHDRTALIAGVQLDAESFVAPPREQGRSRLHGNILQLKADAASAKPIVRAVLRSGALPWFGAGSARNSRIRNLALCS